MRDRVPEGKGLYSLYQLGNTYPKLDQPPRKGLAAAAAAFPRQSKFPAESTNIHKRMRTTSLPEAVVDL